MAVFSNIDERVLAESVEVPRFQPYCVGLNSSKVSVMVSGFRRALD